MLDSSSSESESQQPTQTKRHVFLSPNQKFLCICQPQLTRIFSCSHDFLEIWRDCTKQIVNLQFQESTGMVAYISSINDHIVTIFDIRFNRFVKEIDFIETVVKQWYIRNIIIAVCKTRLIVHDTAKNEHLAYIRIKQPELCFCSSFYQTLRIAYTTSESTLVNLDFWENQKTILEEVSFTEGVFDYKGSIMLLRDSTGFRVYKERCLINWIKFDSSVLTLGYTFNRTQIEQPSKILVVQMKNSVPRVQCYNLFRLNEEQTDKGEYRLLSEQQVQSGVDKDLPVLLVSNDNKLNLLFKNSFYRFGISESS